MSRVLCAECWVWIYMKTDGSSAYSSNDSFIVTNNCFKYKEYGLFFWVNNNIFKTVVKRFQYCRNGKFHCWDSRKMFRLWIYSHLGRNYFCNYNCILSSLSNYTNSCSYLKHFWMSSKAWACLRFAGN